MYQYDTILALIGAVLSAILWKSVGAGALTFIVIIAMCAIINIAEHTKKLSEKGGR